MNVARRLDSAHLPPLIRVGNTTEAGQGLAETIEELCALLSSMTDWAVRAATQADTKAAARVAAMAQVFREHRLAGESTLAGMFRDAGGGRLANLSLVCVLFALGKLSRAADAVSAVAGQVEGEGLALEAHSEAAVDLDLLAGLARIMIDDALTAWQNHDLNLATTVLGLSEEIMTLHRATVRRLLSQPAEGPEAIRNQARIILVAHHFARLGDQACGIAQDTLAAVGAALPKSDTFELS